MTETRRDSSGNTLGPQPVTRATMRYDAKQLRPYREPRGEPEPKTDVQGNEITGP